MVCKKPSGKVWACLKAAVLLLTVAFSAPHELNKVFGRIADSNISASSEKFGNAQCLRDLEEAEKIFKSYTFRIKLRTRVSLVVAVVPVGNADIIRDVEGHVFIRINRPYLCACSDAQLHRTLAHELGHAWYKHLDAYEGASLHLVRAMQRRADQFALKLIGKDMYRQALQDMNRSSHEAEREIEDLLNIDPTSPDVAF